MTRGSARPKSSGVFCQLYAASGTVLSAHQCPGILPPALHGDGNQFFRLTLGEHAPVLLLLGGLFLRAGKKDGRGNAAGEQQQGRCQRQPAQGSAVFMLFAFGFLHRSASGGFPGFAGESFLGQCVLLRFTRISRAASSTAAGRIVSRTAPRPMLSVPRAGRRASFARISRSEASRSSRNSATRTMNC